MASTTLKVTFLNGETICYRNSIDTMMAILRGIKPDRLDLISLEAKGRRLFTQSVCEEDSPYALEIGKGWFYVHKFVDTASKYYQLFQINKVLNLGLNIEIVPVTMASDYRFREVKRNPRKQLIISFGKDKTIEGLNCAETLSQFVKLIGVETVARKNLFWHKKPLLTTCRDKSKRIELEKFRWIIFPVNCQETSDLIRFISALTRFNCQVEVMVA